MSKYHHILLTLVVLLCNTICTTTAVSAMDEDLIVLGLAAENSPKAQKSILQALEQIIVEGNHGTPLLIYNATTLELLAETTIPSVKSANGRKARLKKHLEPVFRLLEGSPPVRDGQGSSLNIPEFMSMIAAGSHPTGTTRVLLIGSPYHTLDPNEAMNYSPGFCPNNAHLQSPHSIFDTTGREGELEGVIVDFILTGDIGSPAERKPVERFLAHWLHAQSGTLGNFLTSPNTVVEQVLNGSSRGNSLGTLDLTDPQPRILPVHQLENPPLRKSTPPIPVVEKAKTHPVEVLGPTTRTVDVYINIDGSSSMNRDLPTIARLAPKIADLGARLTRGFRLAIQLYRQPGRRSELPLTPISESVDGTPSDGMVSVNNFLHDEKTELIERGSDKRMVPHFYGQDTLVDVEGGIKRCLNRLKYSGPDRPVITLIGDTGPIEMDNTIVVSSEDQKSIERTLDAVREFVREFPDTRIIAVFVGGSNRSDEAGMTSERFFKDLAALAGTHGYYTTDVNELESLLQQAILVD